MVCGLRAERSDVFASGGVCRPALRLERRGVWSTTLFTWLGFCTCFSFSFKGRRYLEFDEACGSRLQLQKSERPFSGSALGIWLSAVASFLLKHHFFQN
jgi:hypothetical protein